MNATRLLGASCACCLALAPGAHAQQVSARAAPAAASAPNNGIESVVVTARKVRENLQKVPIAITSLSSATLARASVRTVNDLQKLVPNMYLQKSGNDPQALLVSIRGQKQNDLPLTVDPSVGLYMDGLYLPRTYGLSNALVDLDRVEVLRGPQGTLYGRNTTGGAVSLFSKDPGQKPGGLLDVQGGSYGYVNLQGVLNVPITDDIGLRIVGQHGSHDGFGHDADNRPLDNEDSNYVRAKLKARIAGFVTATLWSDYSENRTGGLLAKFSGLSGGTPPGGAATIETAAENGNLTAAGIGHAVGQLRGYTGGGYYDTDGTAPGYSTFEGERVGLNLDVALGHGLTLRSITGYQHFYRIEAGDLDGTPLDLLTAKLGTRDRYLSQEFQLLGGNKRFNYVLGLYGGDENGDEYSTNSILGAINPNNPNLFDAAVHNRSAAAFAQANWQFIDGWHLTGGFRYSADRREIDSDNRDGPDGTCVVPAPDVESTPPGASQCPRVFEKTFAKPSWLVSLDHQVTSNILAYAKVSRGYRSGGFNYRGSDEIETFAAFAPEIVTEYEVGVKSDLFDHTVRLNLAAYHDDYKNIQRSVTVPTGTGAPATVVTNAASARINGFEGEGIWRLTPNFVTNASVGIVDANYVKFVDLTGNRTGEHFDVPKWTTSAGARYTHDTRWGQAAFQVDYHWQTRVYLVPSAPTISQVEQNAYGLLDARASLDVKRYDMQIALFGKNLTDRHYLASAISLETALGYNYVIPGDPRTFGIEITKHFGGI